MKLVQIKDTNNTVNFVNPSHLISFKFDKNFQENVVDLSDGITIETRETIEELRKKFEACN